MLGNRTLNLEFSLGKKVEETVIMNQDFKNTEQENT